MNEEFLEILFKNLGGEQNGWDKKDFLKSMSADESYNSRVYDRYISLYGEQEFSQEDFQYGTGLKKKTKNRFQQKVKRLGLSGPTKLLQKIWSLVETSIQKVP